MPSRRFALRLDSCENEAVDAADLRYGLTLSGADPAAIGKALVEAAVGLGRRPERVLRRAAELALAEAAVGIDVSRMLLGAHDEPVAAADPSDRRFADRAWRENPALRAALGSYVVSSRVARGLLEDADVSKETRRKARFALEIGLAALAPTNVPWLNPKAVKELFETGGLSAWRGLGNVVDDVLHNNGRPRQFDEGALAVGSGLAATPGRVVYRNDLIELLAYEPQTETVFEQPLLYSPAWINKYYVLDLAPGRSFIEHAVRSGFTVFAISYRNPDESMVDLRLDDYLRTGFLAALAKCSELTGSSKVNVIGVCVGGTLTALALAALAARGEGERIGSATLSVALVDFAEPGGAGAFTDAESIDRIVSQTGKRGYFSGDEVASPFNLMRTTEFFWNYVVSNWYMGRKPAPFDILAWNADRMRLPVGMHAEVLRGCYLENRLVRPGAFSIDGTPVDLSLIDTPLYVLGTETDHIAPWRSVYRTTQHVSGPCRFVLTSGGHIAGMVNPPGRPGAWHRVSGDGCPPDPDRWLDQARTVDGSWWDDWVAWASERSGGRVQPPRLPEGEPAPGRYVRS